jgi:hypothetical protein
MTVYLIDRPALTRRQRRMLDYITNVSRTARLLRDCPRDHG